MVQGEAAEESKEEIRAAIGDAHMVFIVAGMGGGTGTGAAPVVATLAREMGALTVGVVTKPARFEGKRRMRIAEEGIKELSKVIDSIVVIPNDKILAVKSALLSEALENLTADIPARAVHGIADLLIKDGFINLDFKDVKSVMQNSGRALLGVGEGEGENKAIEAIQNAIECPFLEDFDLERANAVLLNLTVDKQHFKVEDLNIITDKIYEKLGEVEDIKFGCVFDDSIGDKAKVTLIATGIKHEEIKLDTFSFAQGFRQIPQVENKEVIRKDDLEIPTFLRRNSD